MNAVVGYRCQRHGVSPHCSVNDVGERVCPDCNRVVEIVTEGRR